MLELQTSRCRRTAALVGSPRQSAPVHGADCRGDPTSAAVRRHLLVCSSSILAFSFHDQLVGLCDPDRHGWRVAGVLHDATREAAVVAASRSVCGGGAQCRRLKNTTRTTAT